MSKIGKSTKSSNGKFILKIISYIYIPSFYNLSKKKKENLNNNRAFIKKKFVKILKRSYALISILIKKTIQPEIFINFLQIKIYLLNVYMIFPSFPLRKINFRHLHK